MKRVITVVLMAVAVNAQTALNWRGAKDTAAIANFKEDAIAFTKAFPVSNGENMLAYVCADDTSSDGFSGDSTAFLWGYQVGWPVVVSANTWDTVWSNGIVLDTFGLAKIYDPATLDGDLWITDSTGVIIAHAGQVDTTSVSGYALQWCGFAPPWAPYLRLWFKGLAGNITESYLKMFAGIVQRKYVPTGESK